MQTQHKAMAEKLTGLVNQISANEDSDGKYKEIRFDEINSQRQHDLVVETSIKAVAGQIEAACVTLRSEVDDRVNAQDRMHQQILAVDDRFHKLRGITQELQFRVDHQVMDAITSLRNDVEEGMRILKQMTDDKVRERRQVEDEICRPLLECLSAVESQKSMRESFENSICSWLADAQQERLNEKEEITNWARCSLHGLENQIAQQLGDWKLSINDDVGCLRHAVESLEKRVQDLFDHNEIEARDRAQGDDEAVRVAIQAQEAVENEVRDRRLFEDQVVSSLQREFSLQHEQLVQSCRAVEDRWRQEEQVQAERLDNFSTEFAEKLKEVIQSNEDWYDNLTNLCADEKGQLHEVVTELVWTIHLLETQFSQNLQDLRHQYNTTASNMLERYGEQNDHYVGLKQHHAQLLEDYEQTKAFFQFKIEDDKARNVAHVNEIADQVRAISDTLACEVLERQTHVQEAATELQNQQWQEVRRLEEQIQVLSNEVEAEGTKREALIKQTVESLSKQHTVGIDLLNGATQEREIAVRQWLAGISEHFEAS